PGPAATPDRDDLHCKAKRKPTFVAPSRQISGLTEGNKSLLFAIRLEVRCHVQDIRLLRNPHSYRLLIGWQPNNGPRSVRRCTPFNKGTRDLLPTAFRPLRYVRPRCPRCSCLPTCLPSR